VLDLQARVHLHEIEGAVLVDDEFDGAGATRKCWKKRRRRA
jgi:hypothetical protein